ncbi:MAG: flavodoxin family protein [Archaeoglobus sp.]|uniref:flavodoxin family protein n=1 Tax=Archaeoglobus sp. TaxID=1872626 RepID=UPI001DD52276|nr:flavodoxin family protein [Archaeoglobus sp.]MBO8179939.1 flavodoxin family protein [Archaeoglobus sp.]
MKAVGILGSPRKYGNTSKMLDAALEELKERGFETKKVHLSSKKINYCTGCGTCLAKKDCVQKDDMVELKKLVEESDAVILASPVYYLNVTAQMKTFIDRMLAYGHRPTLQGKYGGSIVVYAGVGKPEEVAGYLNRVLKAWGIVPVGYAVGFGVIPGEVGQEDLEKASLLGKNIAEAYEKKYRAEPTEEDFELQKQLLTLIKNYGNLMKADYDFWKERGLI